MEHAVPTIKVTDANHPDGYHINEADFDADKHTKFEDAEGGDAKKADLTVAQMKEALIAKGVEIPANAKKADLQALLDANQ